MRVGVGHAGEGIDGMADRRIRVQAPPPASEVVQPKSATDAQIANRGVNLGLVGRLRSITAELFPQGVVFDLMQGLRIAADRLLENFSVRNVHLADRSVDQRVSDLNWIENEHLGPVLRNVLRNLVADVEFLGVDVDDPSGIDRATALALIRANAITGVSGGTGISVSVDGGVATITSTGEAPEAEGAPTSVELSLSGRELTVTIQRQGQTAISDTVTLPQGEGTGGDDAATWAENGNTDPIPASKLTNAPSASSTAIASAVATYLQANPPGITDAAIQTAVDNYLADNPIVGGVTETRVIALINNNVERFARIGGAAVISIAKIQGALNTFRDSASVTSRIQTVAREDRDNIVTEERVYDHMANIIQEA